MTKTSENTTFILAVCWLKRQENVKKSKHMNEDFTK